MNNLLLKLIVRLFLFWKLNTLHVNVWHLYNVYKILVSCPVQIINLYPESWLQFAPCWRISQWKGNRVPVNKFRWIVLAKEMAVAFERKATTNIGNMAWSKVYPRIVQSKTQKLNSSSTWLDLRIGEIRNSMMHFFRRQIELLTKFYPDTPNLF